jgi:4-hydroxybenzoate polyprenyltransferase
MFVNLVKLARPAQWLKNLFVLAPLIFAGEANDLVAIGRALIATGIFCLLSSAVYAFNDLIDRESDRQHPLKKHRPLASGAVSAGSAVAMIAALVIIGLVSAWLLGRPFFIAALLFMGLNLLYSLALKNLVILDAMGIALSFVLRGYAGAMAINVPVSQWLLINTLLLALFMAFGKRRHELTMLHTGATAHRKILSRYSPYLLDQLIAVTTPSVVVMYMLYTMSSEVSSKLHTNNLYLTIPFVVYGIFRYLYLIHKEDKGGSPTEVLLEDRPLALTVLLWALSAIAILYLFRT